jgi:hypothetical protein
MTVTLKDLLIPYESRKGILQQLSAWDVAKLDLYLGGILDEQERKAYLNPIRDIFYHVAELNSLLKGGMKLVLLGNDTSHLYRRLKDPGRYATRTNRSKRLHLYLLGMFPVQLEEKDLLDRMIKFCLYSDAHPARVHYDKAVFKVIQSQRPNGAFLTSFGVPIREGRIEDRGFWHTFHEVPERSIKLKLYVPCFRDRWLGQASLRLSELSRVSGHTLNFCKLQTVWALMCIYARRYTLEGAISGEEERVAQAGSVQISLSIRFPYTKYVLRII